MNKFNFLGFMIAHHKGKDLDKKDRNKNALLAAFIPSDNFTSVITPVALVEKEVQKKENEELSEKNAKRKKAEEGSQRFVAEFIIDNPKLESDEEKVALANEYLTKVYPKVQRLDQFEKLEFARDLQQRNEVIWRQVAARYEFNKRY